MGKSILSAKWTFDGNSLYTPKRDNKHPGIFFKYRNAPPPPITSSIGNLLMGRRPNVSLGTHSRAGDGGGKGEFTLRYPRNVKCPLSTMQLEVLYTFDNAKLSG